MITKQNRSHIVFKNETVESINYQRDKCIKSYVDNQIGNIGIPLLNTALAIATATGYLSPSNSIVAIYSKYMLPFFLGIETFSKAQEAIDDFNHNDHNHAFRDISMASICAIGAYNGYTKSNSVSLLANTFAWMCDAAYNTYNDVHEMNHDLNIYNIAENYIKATGEHNFILEI